MHDMPMHYNIMLVFLSYAVSVLGAFTGLQLALNIPLARTSKHRTVAILAAGTAIGGGAIWAMHYIAMLACDMGAPVRYDIGLTVASAVLAIAACSAGLAIVASGGSRLNNLLVAGVLTGLGVAGMHYLGMAAILSSVDISYKMGLVVLSVVIAIVASMVALWLAFNLRGAAQMFGSAVVMGVAVCGMHYTGMAAVILTAGENQQTAPTTGLDSGDLGMLIFGVTTALLLLALGISTMRRRRRAALTI